jgi:hypothetical protein
MPREYFWAGTGGCNIQQSLSLEDGKLLSETGQPERDQIMVDIANQRLADRKTKDLKMGRLYLEVPEMDLWQLKLKYPELGSKDAEIKTRAWKKFIHTTEAKPYLIRDLKKQGHFNGAQLHTQ